MQNYNLKIKNQKSFNKIHNSKFFIKNSLAAFTLIEMTVVVAIIGLISGLALAHYRAGAQVSDLQLNAQRIAGVLKQAQSLALSGQVFDGSRTGCGVYFSNNTTYILFADTNSNYNYNSGDRVIQSFTLPSRLVIQTQVEKSFLFDPPNAKFYFEGILDTDEKAIEIRHQTLSRSLMIYVNGQTGRIEIR